MESLTRHVSTTHHDVDGELTNDDNDITKRIGIAVLQSVADQKSIVANSGQRFTYDDV